MKFSEINDDESLKIYLIEGSSKNKITITSITFITLLILFFSVNWSSLVVFYASIVSGIAGTFMLGLTTQVSVEAILEESSENWGFNKFKARSMLRTKLLSALGTIFLLSSLLLQSIHSLQSLF